MKKEILMENEILMEKGDLLTPLKSSLDKKTVQFSDVESGKS